MKVAMSKRFIGAFAKEAAALGFVKELKEWKSAGDPCSFLTFGKDVRTKVPIGHDFDYLNHVHLMPPDNNKIPEDVLRVNRWLNNYYASSTSQRCNRSSDLILYYAGYKEDIILLAVDTHAAMSASGVSIMCELADKWTRAKMAAALAAKAAAKASSQT